MTNQIDMYAEQIAVHLANIDTSLERIAGALRSIAYDCAFKYSDDWIKTQRGVNNIISAENTQDEEPYAD